MAALARRWLIVAEGLLLGMFVVLLVTMRRGLVTMSPRVIAVICGALGVTLIAHAITVLAARRFESAMVIVGVFIVFAGGLANWLFSLQGYVILTELDALPLAATKHLQAFEAGPLSNPSELAGMMQLEKFELAPTPEGFTPTSRVRILQRGGQPVVLTLTPAHGATRRSLRFHQGTFGFAPRIVITRGDRTVFDQVVPFTTRTPSAGVVEFSGDFNVRAEELSIHGAVSLEGLDAQMKGHPRLGLVLKQRGAELGRGELLPGHFAELRDGYRVGFAGVKKWSEIDISRRNYPEPMIAGAALFVAGGAARLFKRRRR